MAVETPPRPAAPADDVDAGVIKNARKRQQQHHLIAAAVLSVGVLGVGLIVGFTDGRSISSAGHLSAASSAVRHDLSPRCTGAGGSTVLTAAPGPYMFSLYVTNADSGAKYATICLNGVEDGSGGFNEKNHPWPPAVAAGHIQGLLTQYSSLQPKNPKGPWAVAEVGRAGAGVSSVSAMLSTGQEVQATVSHGWYLVWWRPAERGHTDRLVVATKSKTYEIPDPNGRFPTPAPRGAGRRRATGVQP